MKDLITFGPKHRNLDLGSCPGYGRGYHAVSVVPVNEELLEHCTEICSPPPTTVPAPAPDTVG